MNNDGLYSTLKQNLLGLTTAVAPHYDAYDDHFFASRAYRQFENRVIAETIAKIYENGRYVFADLGCATGLTLYRFASEFSKELYGFDISDAMIKCAEQKLAGAESELRSRICFQRHDLEDGIPLPTGSVSFISLNLGTASDIRNIGELLLEIQRVLRRAGRFVLSFYNRDALLYNWNCLPWPTSMAAEMDHDREILKVHFKEQVYEVYARAYSISQVKNMIPNRLKVNEIFTYPAISSILPESAFQDERASLSVIELDRQLASSIYGAYLIMTGERSMFD